MNNELKGLGEMFGLDEELSGGDTGAGNQNEIVEIKLSQLVDYQRGNIGKNRYSEKDMSDLVASVKDNGIVQPIVVRPFVDGTYEIILGHHRRDAAILAGLSEIPCIIREMDDNTAELVFMESNIQHGFETMLHSEKAELIYRRNEALKAQGRRMDLMEPEEKEEYQTAKDEFHLSGTTLKRYLRVYQLSSKLKEFLDQGNLSLRSAVNLSYLPKEFQDDLAEIIEKGQKITEKTSEELRRRYNEKQLSKDFLEEICQKKKTTISKNGDNYKISPPILKKFFPVLPEKKEMDQIIEKALNLYFELQE